MNYKQQRQLFKKAISSGWPGKEPSVLGTHSSDAALDNAEKYLATGYGSSSTNNTARPCGGVTAYERVEPKL